MGAVRPRAVGVPREVPPTDDRSARGGSGKGRSVTELAGPGGQCSLPRSLIPGPQEAGESDGGATSLPSRATCTEPILSDLGKGLSDRRAAARGEGLAQSHAAEPKPAPSTPPEPPPSPPASSRVQGGPLLPQVTAARTQSCSNCSLPVPQLCPGGSGRLPGSGLDGSALQRQPGTGEEGQCTVLPWG